MGNCWLRQRIVASNLRWYESLLQMFVFSTDKETRTINKTGRSFLAERVRNWRKRNDSIIVTVGLICGAINDNKLRSSVARQSQWISQFNRRHTVPANRTTALPLPFLFLPFKFDRIESYTEKILTKRELPAQTLRLIMTSVFLFSYCTFLLPFDTSSFDRSPRNIFPWPAAFYTTSN